MRLYYSRVATFIMLMAVAVVTMPCLLQAAITVNPSNIVSSAESGFNYGGELGISLLGIACLLGAIMFGWRLKSGRGK